MYLASSTAFGEKARFLVSVHAGIYVRISRDTEQLGLGVKRQRADCEKLAAEKGWIVVSVYEDNDVSATKAKVRPAYERLMSDIEAGVIAAVIVWDVDRLTRSPRELEDVIDYANKIGLQLASVGGEIDLGTEQGRMLARMKGTVARYETEQQRRRLKAKHLELANSGQYNGPRPFGWDFVSGRKLVVNPDEAAVLTEMVDRVLAGETIWKITLWLNAQKIPTSRGGQWQTQVVRRTLLRWTNCGVRVHHGREAGSGQWEAIVDRATHERVVAILTDPARRTNNRGTAPVYLLTSLAFCGACGKHVVGVKENQATLKSGRVRVYPASYRCPHAGCLGVSRSMVDVDDLVSGSIVKILERDGVRLLGGNPVRAKLASDRINELQARLAIAADAFADGLATADQFRRITAKLRPRIEAERTALAVSQPPMSVTDFTGTGAGQAWEAADVETRKRLIKLLKMRVTILPVGSGNMSGGFDPASVSIEHDPTLTFWGMS